MNSRVDPARSAGGHGSSVKDLRVIYAAVSEARRRQLYLLLGLMVLNAVAEVCTIGAVLPLLTVLSQPRELSHNVLATKLLGSLSSWSHHNVIFVAAAIFCSLALAAGLLRFWLVRLTYVFGYGLAHELAFDIQRRLLWQPYSFHVSRNTSSLISSLEKANILVFDVVLPVIQASTGCFIAISILSALVIIAPVAAAVTAAVLCVIYLLISRFTQAKLAANSRVVAISMDKRLKVVQESLAGIRDVIIDGAQAAYLASFDQQNGRLGSARASNATMGVAPRFLVEAIGIVAITVIALGASEREGGLAAALPVLGAIALGAQRLLPLVQQIFKGWVTAAGHLSLVGQAAKFLALHADRDPTHVVAPLPFREKISLAGVSFKYPGRDRAALTDINLEISAGAAIGIIGETGSGKSTLADLLMGLIEPTSGDIRIDDTRLTAAKARRWQRNVAHVAQSVFLADKTIAENIALSVPEKPASLTQVVDAAKCAQLHQFIDTLPDRYETEIGERGVRLSGGQRQRLGIARALYKQAPVLVLDEATNALDFQTEEAVLNALRNLRIRGQTLIIISHRHSTIKYCDVVLRLEGGRVAP